MFDMVIFKVIWVPVANAVKWSLVVVQGLPKPLQTTMTMSKVSSRRILGCWLFPDSLQYGDIRPRSPFNWPLRSGHGQLRGTLILCPTTTISDRELRVVIVVSEWLISFLLDTGVTYLVPNRVCSYSCLSTRKETLPKSLHRLQVCLSYPSLTHSHLEEV